MKRSALLARNLQGLVRASTASARTAPQLAGSGVQRTYTTMSNFPGASSPFTNKLDIRVTTEEEPIPCYRIMDPDGSILNSDEMPDLDDAELLNWYKIMFTQNQMDTVLYESQRQGRISFYMTSYGEEGIHVGSAAALSPEDVIYAQYRETGVLMYRGFTLREFMDQCYANATGHGKGRQMPVHYGSKRLNFHTISSPLATQLPQAAGAAYRLKGSDRCVVCYFGDGSASEGDAHPAFNFSATLECPVIFFCRNNGFAISTPTHEQYRGDGIAGRASAYGMDCVRVDGNDAFAVYNATLAARKSTIKNKRPIILEAMTYRIGHHSTSDDSGAYRAKDQVELFQQDNPITRFGNYLRARGLWNDDLEAELGQEASKLILAEFTAAEKRLKPPVAELFEDVFDHMPSQLEKQRQQLNEHLGQFGEHYNLASFEPSSSKE